MNRTDIAPLPAVQSDPSAEIARLAARYRRANGPVIVLMNRLGGRIEDRLGGLPPEVRARIDSVTRSALEKAYHLAASGRHAPDLGPRGPMALAALTGAAGGAGGLATSIAELPVTIAVILHAIRRAAAEEGFDPDDPAIRFWPVQVAGQPVLLLGPVAVHPTRQGEGLGGFLIHVCALVFCACRNATARNG